MPGYGGPKDPRITRLRKVVTVAFGDVLAKVDQQIYHGDVHPKHGPGATADRKRGNQKWILDEWTERLEAVFPYVDFALPSYRYWDRVEEVLHLPPDLERPSKLVAVPKTQATPRLIAEEPTCMQYMQQAVARPLVEALESKSSIVSPMIGFTDQRPNNWLAAIGSEDGSLATLDLSEASDRLGNWLVEALFSDFPHFSAALQATRSTRTVLPSGEVIELRKFASMGSALTFPIEAMVFLAIAIMGTLEAEGRQVTRRNIIALHDRVRVYGDDIIVPTSAAVPVVGFLELFGLKVNRRKSFWTGWFRESCGREYWRGMDVSITRVRTAIPESLAHVDEIISFVETRNLLAQDACGFPRLVQILDDHLEKLLGFFPWVTTSSPVLGRVHPSGLYQVDRMSARYHSPQVKGYRIAAKPPMNQLDGVPALMKCLSSTIGVQDVDPRHLQRSGRPRAVNIKLGMASPF